mmetsp:Transcript_32102/g.91026  ORF Transcript_32102/g.91026 Transcript_32102/m.91026 type:complete len:346 (+) Transcript_32102:195-1232(+)
MDKAVENDVDLYKELGVAPDASEDQLKKVYRKLVLRYHPDKLTGKSDEEKAAAQDKFQKLVTAYEILSNPHQRAMYDTRAAKKGGQQDDVLLNVTLKESVLGTQKLAPVPFKKRCEACKAVGMTCKPCEACGGKPAWITQGPKCTACQGRGFGEPEICKPCKGHGHREEFDMVRISVPPGANTGSRIPIPGKPIHARVFVLPSKLFKRAGNDVESTLELTEAEAEDGGPFEIETLHGKDMVFLTPPISEGDTKVVEGRGVIPESKDESPGNHIVRIAIKVGGAKRPAAASADSAPKKAKEDGAASQPGSAPAAAAATDKDSLSKLLAEKKAALLATLQAKQGGGK